MQVLGTGNLQPVLGNPHMELVVVLDSFSCKQKVPGSIPEQIQRPLLGELQPVRILYMLTKMHQCFDSIEGNLRCPYFL